MPFSKARQTNFNALRKLNLQDRIDAVADPKMGQFLISMLSPTQAAELFPKYYIERNQNISGFLKAIPSSLSAAKQKEYEQQLENTASGESAGANYNAGGYRKKWQENVDAQKAIISKKGVTPPPQLSPEQKAAFDALKAGDIDINDERMKWLKNAPKEVLGEVGISIVKDDKGAEKFHYAAPKVSEEDARKSMISGAAAGTGAWAKDAEFMNEVNRVSSKLGIKANDLLSVMAFESGISAQSVNRNGGATGLIQFMPATARRLGTTTEELRGMSRAEQMKWVEKYLIMNGVKPGATAADIYSKVFLPARSNQYVLTSRGENYYEQNRGLDIDGDGRITKDDLNRAAYGAGRRHGVGVTGEDPITQNYTPQQIAARQRELESSAEAGRLGKLASITQPQGETQSSVKIGQSKDFAQFAMRPGVDNFGGQCGQGARKMAGHMYGHSAFLSEGLGGDGTAGSLSHGNPYFQKSGLFNAARSTNREELTNQAYLDSLPIGTVITSSGGRPGGNNGQGHAQIKIGPNKWASDTVQSHLLVNGSHGHSYDNFKVHIPNEQGLAKLRENGINQTVTSSSNETSSRPSKLPNIPTGVPNIQNIPPDQTPDHVETSPVGDIKPLETVTQPQGPLNTPKAETSSTPAPAPSAAAPAAPAAAPEEPTATVQKSVEQPKPAESSPERYKVDIPKFINAIKQTSDFKSNPLSWMATDSMITSGFNDDARVKAAGVRLDEKGIMHFTKGMTPEAKEAMATFDTKSFMTKIEDKKKEDTPTQVKPKAKGGTTKVSTEEIAAYPIGGLQGDNAVVVNAQQQPLFTMNTNEAAVMNPDTKTVDVIPNQKGKQVGPQQQSDNTPVMNEFTSAIQELQKNFDDLSTKSGKMPELNLSIPEQYNQSWLKELGHVTEIPYRNPTAHRVASRAHGVETGTADNGYHFSHGNKS